MESRVWKLVVVTALIPVAALAQPAEPPPPEPAPPAPAPAPPAPPPAEAPAPTPAPVSPADACRARRHEMEDQASHTSNLEERTRILQSLPDCSHPDAAAPAFVPAETAATAAPAVEAATGFAVELAIDTSLVQVDTNTALSLPQAGIFLGYRAPAATFGIGLDFGRVGSSMDSGGTSSDQSSTTFLIMPGVRVPLAHSGDGRTELLARVDAGYGQISSSTSDSMTDTPSIGHIRLQAAPAVRFWVTHSFAFGAAVGVRYDRLTRDESANGVTASSSQSVTGLFSSFHVVGVF